MSPLELNPRTKTIGLFVARLLMASHYLFSGLESVFKYNDAVAFAASYQIPFARLAVAPATAIDLICGLMLLSPRWCRTGAAILAPWTFFLGIWFHRFWAVSPAEWQMMVDNFFHHFVMTGGLLYLALTSREDASPAA